MSSPSSSSNVVTVLPNKFVPGWDGLAQSAARCETVDLMAALSTQYDDDAHFMPYHVRDRDGFVEEEPPRLNKSSRDAVEEAGGLVCFNVVALDVDCPEAHRTGGAVTDAWWRDQRRRIRELPQHLAMVGWYRTRGGYRLLYLLDQLLGIEEYIALLDGLRAELERYGIVADELRDWGRLYRLPFVLRDGERQEHECDYSALGVLAWRSSAAADATSDERPRRQLFPTRAWKPPVSLSTRVEAHLAHVLEKLACAQPGTRNSTLYEAAARAGECALADLLSPALAEETLIAAATECGLLEDDGVEKCLRTIRSGMKRGARDAASLSTDDRPTPQVWVVKGRLDEAVYNAEIALLYSRFPVYKRSGALVSVNRDTSVRPPSISIGPIGKDRLRLMCAQVANWFRPTKEPSQAVRGNLDPPAGVVHALHAAQEWLVPPLVGLMQTPSLRPDGSVLQLHGYDARTRLFYWADEDDYPPIPDYPTVDDARAALAVLTEAVVDFPFASPVDQAVALSALLTPLLRPTFEGNSPMYLFDSPTPGSGKSLLADMVALLATGQPAAREVEADDEEMRKRITAHLLSDQPVCLLDNISRPLGNAALDAALTAPVWRDRDLGYTRTLTLPNRMLFIATGNNIQIRGDLARRVLRCRLVPDVERPEQRSGFKHPHLIQWVRENRGPLVMAAITLARAYVVADRPDQNLSPFGSFQRWSDLVRSALVWAGTADPLESQDAIRSEADEERVLFGVMLQAWHSLVGSKPVRLAELLEKLKPHIRLSHLKDGPEATLREAMEAVAGPELNAREIANRLLVRWRDRPVDGHVLRRVEMGRRWRVEPWDPAR